MMFDFVLICDEEKVFEGKVKKINIISNTGPVEILPNHQPYMTKIEKLITYETENNFLENFEISEGFVYTNGSICFAVIDK